MILHVRLPHVLCLAVTEGRVIVSSSCRFEMLRSDRCQAIVPAGLCSVSVRPAGVSRLFSGS